MLSPECAIIELDVCQENELKNGEMKEICFPSEENLKLLLVRNEDGKYSAFGNKCPHYGTSLADGVMKNGRIRCSRHGACFNSRTGDIEDFPGLDSLPIHEVFVTKNSRVVIRATRRALKAEKRVKAMKVTHSEETRVVIIGGGASALTCSETLRCNGFSGEIIIISKGRMLPYDRPVMTKDLNAKLEDLYMRSEEFYEEYGIDIRMGKEVSGINTTDKSVTCADGEVVQYDKLLIATGLSPRRLDVPGGHLKNIFIVRSPLDSNIIAKKAREKRVVLIGGSFIGMEMACYLTDICKEVTVCCKHSVPFEKSYGKKVGEGLQVLHERRGVKFFTNNSAVRFSGCESVEKVILQDGTTLEADLVIVGVGTCLNTGFLLNSELVMDSDGFLVVDKYMRTIVKDVYAAGAAVRFPLRCYQNQLVNVEHWQMAHFHGKIVGVNMMASMSSDDENCLEEANSVPFFYTEQYGIEIQYSGFGDEHDDVIVHGNPSEGRFSAFYLKNDVVVAVASMRNGNLSALFADKLLAEEVLFRDDVEKMKFQ